MDQLSEEAYGFAVKLEEFTDKEELSRTEENISCKWKRTDLSFLFSRSPGV